MDKTFTNETLDIILQERATKTPMFQGCSYLTPDGQYFKIKEHYELLKFLVAEQLVQCIPDAEQLLSDLGYIRFSNIGYLILPDKKLNRTQYKELENTLMNISKIVDEISIQVQNQPRLYINYSLDDIDNIIKKIKLFYSTDELLP